MRLWHLPSGGDDHPWIASRSGDDVAWESPGRGRSWPKQCESNDRLNMRLKCRSLNEGADIASSM